jgi:hypothetical protein
MRLRPGSFFKVSGTDPNDGARIVFVWCREKGPDDYRLLGSGHVIGPDGVRPPGISVGQFSVTLALPPGRSPDDVVVTDDTAGKVHLPDVIITPCSTVVGFKFGGRVSSGDRTVREITANASPNSGHRVMACKRS